MPQQAQQHDPGHDDHQPGDEPCYEPDHLRNRITKVRGERRDRITNGSSLGSERFNRNIQVERQ